MNLLLVSLWLLVVVLAVGGMWALYRRPPRVELSRQLPASALCDDRVPLTVAVRISSRWPVRVVLEDPPPRTVVADVEPSVAGWVYGEAQTEVRTTLTLNRRGVYDWPPVVVRWADPLGLFWRQTEQGVPTRLEVYPGVHGLLLPELLRPLLSEGSLSRTLGLDDPISLRGLRDYMPGDSPGRVHWRLTARTGTLTVREPERTAASRLTVYIDLAGGSAVYVESAVRLAASLLREALTLNLPVSVATSGHQTASGRTPEALRAALLHLARLEPEGRPVQSGLQDAGRADGIPSVSPGTNLIVLTAQAGAAVMAQAVQARATASRVALVALPDGFYLEPGENPRRQWVAAPEAIRQLQQQAGVLAESGVLVFVVRGNQSVLRLGAEQG